MPETQIHPARNTNPKHKQARYTKPKHKAAETQAQPETQNRNAENRE